jgi:multiple antibiotic resistance protein
VAAFETQIYGPGRRALVGGRGKGWALVDFAFGAAAILSIIAIVDPPGVVAPFLVLTEGMTKEEKERIIGNSCVVAAVTLAVFAVFGQWIFAVFNFTIPSFKIAGGILLFVTAFQMTQGQRTLRARIAERATKEEVEAIGIVPLGIPLLAGPGAITTVLVYMTKETEAIDKMFVFAGILAAVLLTLILLTSADRVFRRMGRTGTIAFGRIMGLLLAAVGVQFVVDGILQIAASGVP